MVQASLGCEYAAFGQVILLESAVIVGVRAEVDWPLRGRVVS